MTGLPRIVAARVAAAALCAMALGCGGGGSSMSQQPPPPTGPTITKVAVTPSPATATIGTTMQFSATVTGTGNFNSAVNWSVVGPPGWTGSAGSIDDSGLYDTPYPAPASVTVTATAAGDSTKLGVVTVTLQPPAAAQGPELTVDAGNQTHPINPYIYGMNAFGFLNSVDGPANPTLIRWGGDNTSRYNYKLGVTSAGADYFFENATGSYGMPPTGQFNDLVTNDKSMGAATMGTVPVQGWVAKDSTSCGFPVSKYPNQQSVDSSHGCGNGVYPEGINGCTNANGCDVTGNDPTITSTAEGPAWAGNWVSSLVQTFGTAANGGVAIYDLDNEPDWWDATHRDVHPQPFTYDELVDNDLAAALAVKTADPTAEVAGPVLSFWWSFFYSKKDIESGWSTGPCYEPWQNPADRKAHGGIPFVEYYLQQFRDYAANNNTPRLLDYLDLHLYFAATYKGQGVAFAMAGDTAEQEARLNSTRVFWDPSYTDPNFPQPNYLTDSNYTSSCSTPLQAPQMIPLMQSWVAKDYPGTKIATSEYNWGGQESLNGALAQADLLGIFGKYGLDLATLWGAPDASQVPGLIAFEIYRNYDRASSKFGNIALASSSADQGKLSVYGALRSSDQAVTVVVINKSYGALTSTLSLANLTATGNAKVYQYSNANLASIVPLADQPVMPPPAGSATSAITATFPAASITLYVIPTQ
jgi:Glycoside hydrolase family 44